MTWEVVERYLNELLLPNPVKESLFFWFGVILSRLLILETQDEKSDFTKSQSYYWLIGPLAFVVATATVYKKSNLYEHWLFGLPILLSISKYFVDLIFGISLGLIVKSAHISDRFKFLVEKLSKVLKKIQVWLSWLADELRAIFGLIPKVRVMPDLWDRFAPDSQIKVMETFLSEVDSVRDRKSLEFWKTRQNETEKNGFNFRVSLNERSLSKLNFQQINSEEYLGIEFWKKKDGNFAIRTTDQSEAEPKEFKDVTPEQRTELAPHIEYWYTKLK
jgi:hypothetical protein